jgi:hypothetical protein
MRNTDSGNFEGASYVVQEALEVNVKEAGLSSSCGSCGGCSCSTGEEEEEEEEEGVDP